VYSVLFGVNIIEIDCVWESF